MKINSSLFVVTALGLGVLGYASAGFAEDMGGMGTHATSPSTQPSAAVDAGNTKCLVSGEDLGDSKLTETYKGKTYHFCCDGCPAKFKADPEKYIKALEADPAKYGVKAQK